MEAVLGQVEQLPALLAVSRSALVRDWDRLTLDRALQWARYFQHLHQRCRARPQLREALGRRLRRSQPYPVLGFPTLGRCPQLLGLALLENRALPPAACRRLLHSLLQPPGAGSEPQPRSLLQPPGDGSEPQPRSLLQPPGDKLRAEGELLLRRLREERQEGGQAAGQRRWLCRVLEQLPQPRSLALLAAALAVLPQGAGDTDPGGSSPDGHRAGAGGDGGTAGLLLSWLLDKQERFSAFCLCVPAARLASLAGRYSQLSTSYLELLTRWGSQLHYDPLQGRWVKSCLDKAEVSWEELKERFSCLCQGPALLREQTQAALKLLRTRDGDFPVCGLSVWTDLLMEL
ncbi:FANCF protein, partial [Pycnonotus jocosus]|nr:FANCF protein [Pycnonotus jocosus]